MDFQVQNVKKKVWLQRLEIQMGRFIWSANHKEAIFTINYFVITWKMLTEVRVLPMCDVWSCQNHNCYGSDLLQLSEWFVDVSSLSLPYLMCVKISFDYHMKTLNELSSDHLSVSWMPKLIEFFHHENRIITMVISSHGMSHWLIINSNHWARLIQL